VTDIGSSNNQLDLQSLNNTIEFFTDFNYYNYYGLDFLRFYAKKGLKVVGFYSGNYEFHKLIDTLLSLKDKNNNNSESLQAVYQLAMELKQKDSDKFNKKNLKNILEDTLYYKLNNLSKKQQYELSISLLQFAESVEVELSEEENLQKIINDYNDKYGFFNTLTPGKIAAMLFAAAVALSEGIASVYFMGVYTIQSLLFIGVPSFLVNYLLFYPDLEKLICSTNQSDNNTNNSNWLVKFGLPFAAVAAGAMTAFVALNSMLETFGTIFFNLSPALALSAPPIGLITFVSFFAFSSFVANTALLLGGFSLNNVSYFLPKEGKNIFTRLSDNFVDTFKNLINGNFLDASANLGKLLVDSAMLVAGVVLAASIYISSLGLFRNQAVKTLTGVFGLSFDLSDLISIAAVTYCGQLLNGFFYIDKILYPLNSLGNALFAETKESPENTETQKDELFENINNVACANNMFPEVTMGASLGLIAYFSWINGYAQGEGFANDSLSTSGLEWLSFGALTAGAASMYAYCLGTISSFIANYNQASDYIQKDPSSNKI